MLGGLKHKKGRILSHVGWRKTQEGENFQAIFPEVEWPKTQEGEEKKHQSVDSAERSHRRQDTPRQPRTLSG